MTPHTHTHKRTHTHTHQASDSSPREGLFTRRSRRCASTTPARTMPAAAPALLSRGRGSIGRATLAILSSSHGGSSRGIGVEKASKGASNAPREGNSGSCSTGASRSSQSHRGSAAAAACTRPSTRSSCDPRWSESAPRQCASSARVGPGSEIHQHPNRHRHSRCHASAPPPADPPPADPPPADPPPADPPPVEPPSCIPSRSRRSRWHLALPGGSIPRRCVGVLSPGDVWGVSPGGDAAAAPKKAPSSRACRESSGPSAPAGGRATVSSG